MQLGTIEGKVNTSKFKFRAVEEVGKFDFISVKSNGKWILAQVQEVTKQPDGETMAEASIIGYRDKGLTKSPRQVIEPDSIVYEADQELISDTLGLEDAGLRIGNLETNPDISIHVDGEDFYKHFAVLAQTGAGKCVTPETEVLMSDGSLMKIEDIFKKDSDAVIRKTNDEEFRLLSGSEVICIDSEYNQTASPALYGYRKKADEIIEIKLKSGREIEVTPEHPLLKAEAGHNFQEAEEVSEGDHIGVPRSINSRMSSKLEISSEIQEEVERENERRENMENAFPRVEESRLTKETLDDFSERFEVPKSTVENWLYQEQEPNTSQGFVLSSNQKAIQAPKMMTLDLAEFLSLVIAEGTEQHTSGYRIIFTNDDVNLLERFEYLTRKLFDLEVKGFQERALYIDSTALKSWLEEIGYSSLEKSRGKKIPSCVLRASEKCRSRFLKTFYDCEGCMEDHEITLSSASEEIANQVCYMLSCYGIVARIRENYKAASNSDHSGDIYYEVIVSGVSDIETFSEKIGFGMERKQKKLDNYLKSHEGNTNSDIVPIEGRLLKGERNKIGISQRELGERIGAHSTLISLYEREERRPSREKIEDLAKIFDSLKLDKLANSDIFWDEVDEINRKDYDGYVYDLTVKDHHNFVAGRGGIVSHNSYLSGVLLEELLENDFPILILDPHGEYSSLSEPNPEAEGEEPRGYDVKEYSPNTDVNSDAMPLRFSSVNMSKKELLEVIPDSLTNSQMGVLYNALKRLREKDRDYTLNDVMDAVSQEDSTAKWNLLNSMEQIEESGLFSENPVELRNLLEKGRATVINLKAVEPEATEMTAYLLAKRLFNLRKKDKVPPFVMLMEEAHNFAPEQGFGKAVSSEILRKIASEGRKFGLGIGVISQRPARIDKNVLSQCNTQFILRVSNPNDIKAISKSFEGVTSEVESMITSLPPGVCFVLGNEYPVMTEVRERRSKHGGTTQTADDYEEKVEISHFDPEESVEEVEQREGEKFTISYYPLYLLENEEKKLLIDGRDGELKAERHIPSGLESELLEKLENGLSKSEAVNEMDLTLTKFSSMIDSLRSKGLIKEDELERTESVLDLDQVEEDVREGDLINFQINESEVKSRLEDARISRVYYPYYSQGDDVYDPILKQSI